MTKFSRLPLGLPDGSLVSQFVANAIDFLFPPHCLECSRAGKLLCEECQNKIPAPPPVQDSPYFEKHATAEFSGTIRKAIHALKYEQQFRYATPLADRLTSYYSKHKEKHLRQATVITAVPLHNSRLKERGYNQSALLAARLAQGVGIRFCPELIMRVRETRTQVGLGMHERQANVADAFKADAILAANQYVLIVDDVCTTGATLHECAKALLDAGAIRVWALTVAKAVYNQATEPIDQ
jgi:ComF family protein